MNDINWKEVLKETLLAILAVAMFAPAMLIAYGMLATLQENETMKTLKDARQARIFKYLPMLEMSNKQLSIWNNLSFKDRLAIRTSDTYRNDTIAY